MDNQLKYVDVRLFFNIDGELEEIIMIKSKLRNATPESMTTDVPFEEYNASADTLYAGQIPVGVGKVVILYDKGSEYDKENQ